MSAVKFTFDTEFAGEKDVTSDAAQARKVKSLTQSEIDAIKAAAIAEGRQAAEVRAQEALAAGVEDAAIAVREALSYAMTQIESLRAEAADLALAAARTLADSALDRFGAATVETALREALHQAIGEPRVALRANPGVAEALRPRLDVIAHEEGFEGRLTVVADPSLANADCRIEWRGGGAERSVAAIQAALAEAVAQHFGPVKPIAMVRE